MDPFFSATGGPIHTTRQSYQWLFPKHCKLIFQAVHHCLHINRKSNETSLQVFCGKEASFNNGCYVLTMKNVISCNTCAFVAHFQCSTFNNVTFYITSFKETRINNGILESDLIKSTRFYSVLFTMLPS